MICIKFSLKEKVFLNFLSRQDEKRARVSVKFLSELLGCSERTVKRVTKKLEEGGLIEKLHIISVDRTLAYRLIKKERHAPVAPKSRVKMASSMVPKLPHAYIEDNNINNKLINLNKSNKSTCENFEKKNLGKDYPKPTIVQDMLRIWNEELGREDFMSKSVAPWLMEAFKKFQRSLDNWRSYLRRIKTSAYLMGAKFKVYLKWALSFRVIDCILRGGFGCGAEFSTPEEKEAEIRDRIADLREGERCKDFRRRVLQKYGAKIYNAWFAELLLEEEEGKLMIGYPNNFMKSWVETHFLWDEIKNGECRYA
jgi:DNA-binding Lrp family transcriptional regulator